MLWHSVSQCVLVLSLFLYIVFYLPALHYMQACELHVIEVADPIEHFGQISSGMVEEAIHTMTLQSEDTEQEKGTLGQDSQASQNIYNQNSHYINCDSLVIT